MTHVTRASSATWARHWHLVVRHKHPAWHGHCKRGHTSADTHWHGPYRHRHTEDGR